MKKIVLIVLIVLTVISLKIGTVTINSDITGEFKLTQKDNVFWANDTVNILGRTLKNQSGGCKTVKSGDSICNGLYTNIGLNCNNKIEILKNIMTKDMAIFDVVEFPVKKPITDIEQKANEELKSMLNAKFSGVKINPIKYYGVFKKNNDYSIIYTAYHMVSYLPNGASQEIYSLEIIKTKLLKNNSYVIRNVYNGAISKAQYNETEIKKLVNQFDKEPLVRIDRATAKLIK